MLGVQAARREYMTLCTRLRCLEDSQGGWAIISCEFCYLSAESVAEIRVAVHKRTGILPERVFVATTHTHAGPHDRHADNWARPLADLIADAVEDAYQARLPARIGSGYGFLYGYSINRRWLDRPIDPAITVLRVDDGDGELMGLISVFACHAVVLGSDNVLLSGDWPGYAMSHLESTLGKDITCLFLQGGCGDINPLVAGVREHLRDGHPVMAIGKVSTYYGQQDDASVWNIGNRKGGTFAEVAELGDAFADQVGYITGAIATTDTPEPFWSEQVIINAAADPGEHKERPAAILATERPALCRRTEYSRRTHAYGAG